MNNFLKFLNKKVQGNQKELQSKLIHLLYEYLRLRMQLKLGELKELHLLRKYRRDIAKIKFRMSL